MYDLIVVGGGPAGLTAAIYAIRKRLDVLLVSQDLGGKINYEMELPDIETHRVIRGVEVVEKFWRELDYLNFARRLERVAEIEKPDDHFAVHLDGGDTLEAHAVVYATGARVRQLGVPGEKAFLGRGLSYSAISYAPLFIDKETVVIGDGKLALRAVAELAKLASTVHVVMPTHGELDSPMAQKLLQDNLKVVVWEEHHVKELAGNEFVDSVILETPDGKERMLEADGVFVELGLIPNSEPVAGLVDRDDEGRIVVNRLNQTNCTGLFAAGDVTNAYAEQVLIAVGEGAKAALSAAEYLLLAS